MAQLFVDLGDAFTKALLVDPSGSRHARFPSVVARELLPSAEAETDLTLGADTRIPRPADFDPKSHPRTRSYPGGSGYLARVPSAARPRFAGWLATAFGADRQLLGHVPSPDNVDALVHKALLATGATESPVRLTLLTDPGRKGESIWSYARPGVREAAFRKWTVGSSLPRPFRVRLEVDAVDGLECARHGLPPFLDPADLGHLMVVDIGYLRTKLAVLSERGCEQQEQIDGAGVVNVVHRILRDEQVNGLVEDELAVASALERLPGPFEIEGRRFTIDTSLHDATRSLSEEVAAAANRLAVDRSARHGDMCRGIAVVGGGAALVGSQVAARLVDELGLATSWVTPDTRFFLVRAAARSRSATP